MKKYNKITPEGTKDLLFAECFARRHVEKTLSAFFGARGYHEVTTPGIEFYDVFSAEDGGFSQEEMYKTADRFGRIVVVRPDSTMPIARLTATRLQNLPKPVRLYYTQQVYRNHRGQRGKSDEMTQTGIELLGASGFRADLEVLVTAMEALSDLTPDFRLELGHAGFFRSLSSRISLSAEAFETVRFSIETKNDSALADALSPYGDTPETRAIRLLPRLFGGREIFEEAASLCFDRESSETLSYLEKLYKALCSMGYEEKILIDLGLVQRNNYYTGVIFGSYAEGCGDAILSGGRYDNLVSRFGDTLPAIGFAVNADAVAQIAMKSGLIPRDDSPRILVHGDEGFELAAISYCKTLSAGELSVFETREEARAYARASGFSRIDFVGQTVFSEELI